MPQIGWIYKGNQYTHEEMIRYAADYPPDFDYTVEMLEGMFQGTERDHISPTMLYNCPRQVVLKNQSDYYVPVEYAWAAFRGTIAHSIMQMNDLEPDAIIEKQLQYRVQVGPPDIRKGVDANGNDYEIDVNNILIKGTPDKVVPSKKLLVDYKTVQKMESSPKPNWITQLSLYRWLLHKNGIEVDRAIIQQIGMKAPRRMMIPLWGLEKTEWYLMEKIVKFKGAFDGTYSLETGFLPPVLSPKDDLSWLCKIRGEMPAWCPVQNLCFALADMGLDGSPHPHPDVTEVPPEALPEADMEAVDSGMIQDF